MTEEELEQRHKELQKAFMEEREYQDVKSSYEVYKKERLKKSIEQIQTEFDTEVLSDEEVERINIDLTAIKRVLMDQGKGMAMLQDDYNRLLQLFFSKENEIEKMKRERRRADIDIQNLEHERRLAEKDIIEMKQIILQQQKRINDYENELMNLQNDKSRASMAYKPANPSLDFEIIAKKEKYDKITHS